MRFLQTKKKKNLEHVNRETYPAHRIINDIGNGIEIEAHKGG